MRFNVTPHAHCRKTNYGTRIDYILCSLSLSPHLSIGEVWPHLTGSDHCPVMAEFPSLSLLPSPQEPSLSLRLLLGRQTTLASFIEPKFSQQEVKPTATADSQKEVNISASAVKNGSGKGVNSSGKGVKRKAAECSSSKSKTPRTLQSFFNPSTSNESTLTSEKSEIEEATRNDSPSLLPSSSSSTSSQLRPEWSSLFSGPPKPPLCKNHREPAILRTVRKAGPTKGRQFWVCSRPAGSKSDPNTQCNFFQWLSASRGKSKIT